MPPLFAAIHCRDIEKVKALLESGSDPNERLMGYSAVWSAAQIEDPRYLSILVAKGGSLEGVKDDRNTSALLGAMSLGFHKGRWENYYFALNAGADPNILYGPAPGITAAEKAVGLGLFDKVLELLDRGYVTNLARLERIAKTRQIDSDSEQAKFKQQLLSRLAAK